MLVSLKGKFILSINDRPEIRDLFSGCRIEPASLRYTVSGAPTEALELIISSN